jgi:hypothetical protein
MRTLIQGKTLSPGDLGINVRDGSGRLVDPFSITYTIFSVDENQAMALASAPRLSPSRTSQGTFYASGMIPTIWLGMFKLVWYLQQYEGNEETQIYEEFEVCRVDPVTTGFEAASVLLTSAPGLSRRIAERVVSVRELLSDENPDRNYHFRPPTSGKVIAGFNERVGYIWTDRTIIRMLKLAMSKANTANPMNLYDYTIENCPQAWADAISVGAASYCLSKEAARWAEESFSYSLNGISLDLNKASEYQALAGDYRAEFTEWLPNLTANRPACAGLRQQRWLLG